MLITLIKKIRNGIIAFLPKERYFLAAVVILPLVIALRNVFLYLFSPAGYVYAGDNDEIVTLASAMVVQNNFEAPWETIKIFFSPVNGPPYFIAVFGMASIVLNVSPLVLQAILKYIFTVVILCTVYNIMGMLIKDESKKWLSFLLFLLYNGFGGIVYLFGRLLTNPERIFFLTPHVPFILDLPEIGTAGGVYALNQTISYHIVSLATSYLALLVFLKGGKYTTLASGILLGLSLILYPTFGLSSALLMLLFTIVRFSKENAMKVLYVYFISAPFAVPWVYNFLLEPRVFYLYITKNFAGSALIQSYLISFFGLFVFCLYGIKHKINKRFIFGLTVPTALFSLTRVVDVLHNSTNPAVISTVQSNGALLLLRNLYGHIFVIEVAALLIVLGLIYTAIKRVDLKEDSYSAFLVWLLLFFFLSAFSQNAARLVAFLIVPAAVVASEGIMSFSKFHKIDYKKLAAVIIILSLPSLVIATGIRFYHPREMIYPTYYTPSEYSALKFLKSFPLGMTLASRELGTFLPLHSEKKTVINMDYELSIPNYSQRIADYNAFFSNSENSVKRGVLEKYNIRYVVFGHIEKNVSGDAEALDGIPFLQKIYDDNSTKIFIVKSD